MRTASTKLKTETQRSRLLPRIAPYFNTIAPRRLLGYVRVSASSAGNWIVQVEIGRTKTGAAIRRRETLGVADDLGTANGTDVLSYQQAHDAASAWQPTGSTAGPGAFTVRHAVEQHRNFGGKRGDKTERSKLHAYNTLRWNVLREDLDGKPRPGENGLGEVRVADLTTEMLNAWRDAMVRYDLKTTDEWAYKASRATAERVWSNFRSCLEQAYKRSSNGIKSADAWRNVESLGKTGNRREVHFALDEAVRYIEKCRENGDTAEAELFEAYAWTGARPGGELASLNVGDFNARLHRISIPERSETVVSKTGARQITLTDEAVEFFNRITAGRSGQRTAALPRRHQPLDITSAAASRPC